MSRPPTAPRAPADSRFRAEPSEEERTDSQNVPIGVLEGDEVAWRSFVARHDAALRTIVRQATETTNALSDDQIDDVMGDFWLAVVSNDMRLLRSFKPERGSTLLTWLTFHVAKTANNRVARLLAEPTMVPLDEALHVPAPWPRPARARKRSEAPKLPSGRGYSNEELALVTDFALFLVKLGCDGKLDEDPPSSDGMGKPA